MTNKADRPFSEVAAAPENANWEKLIARPSALYNAAKVAEIKDRVSM